MEDTLAALLRTLHVLPDAAHVARGLGHRVAEDVDVAADELGLDLGRDGAQVSGLVLLQQQAEEVDLEEQVAELAVLLARVPAGDGVGELVDLLDRVRDDVGGALLAIPWALLAQDRRDPAQREQFLGDEAVGERVTGRDGLDGQAARGGGGEERPRQGRP